MQDPKLEFTLSGSSANFLRHKTITNGNQTERVILHDGAHMKILVAIASWGTKNDQYLAQLVREYHSMSFDVDIIVISNISKAVAPGVKVLVVDLRGKNPNSLPYPHKDIFADWVHDYDLFIYSEDDTLITERNIRAFLEATAVLPENEIAGFLRFERGAEETINYPDIHGHFHWDCQSVRRRGKEVFAALTNEHSACYVLTRHQLQGAIASGGFLVGPHRGKYDLLCSAATDPYTQCGLQKVIGISTPEDFLVHHLPNKYVGSEFGVAEAELRRQFATLLKIGRNGCSPTPLFRTESRLMYARFSKDFYEPARDEVLSAIPDGVRNVLSVGCGWGAMEVALAERGLRVIAVPIDPVIGNSARDKGVKIVEGDIATARKKLGDERFDCLLLLNVLHLVEDPVGPLRVFAPTLREGGTAIVQVPRVLRHIAIPKLIRGDQRIQDLRSFKNTGVHFTSRRAVRRWLEGGGLKVENVISLPSQHGMRLPRTLQRLLNPMLAEETIFVAKKR